MRKMIQCSPTNETARRCANSPDPAPKELASMRPDITPSIIARFWAKVDKNGPISAHRPDLGPCWQWTACRVRGYGQFGLPNRQRVGAHRFAYELLVGPIPDGLQLDHLCRIPSCVNPAHLEPVTNRENVLRGMAPSSVIHRSGFCSFGHEMTPENTYIRPSRPTQYVCRTCRRVLRAAYKARRSAKRREANR